MLKSMDQASLQVEEVAAICAVAGGRPTAKGSLMPPSLGGASLSMEHTEPQVTPADQTAWV